MGEGRVTSVLLLVILSCASASGVRGAEDVVGDGRMSFQQSGNGIDGVLETFALMNEAIGDEDAMRRG
jgi:hypothetical protein